MSFVEPTINSVPEVALSGVSRQFDDTFSLQKIVFSVAAGESVVLIGPSAAGKTVTLKTIAGLFQPDSGSITIRGNEVIGRSEVERVKLARLGILFQKSALFDSLTVWENITFRSRQTKKLRNSDAIELARSKLASVGLSEDTALLYPADLSGGMQN